MSGGKADAPAVPLGLGQAGAFGLNAGLGAIGQAETNRDAYTNLFYGGTLPYAQRYMDSEEQSQHASNDFASSIQDLSTGAYQPLEYDFIKQASNYASPERQNYIAGDAATDQYNAGNAARDNAIRTLTSYGVDPSAMKFGKQLLESDSMTAANAASAASMARRGVYDTQLGLENQAIQTGTGAATRVANLRSVAGTTGGAGVTAGNQTFQTGSSALGTVPALLSNAASFGSAGSGAYGSQASAQNQRAQIQNQAAGNFASGIGQAIGTVARVGLPLAFGPEGFAASAALGAGGGDFGGGGEELA